MIPHFQMAGAFVRLRQGLRRPNSPDRRLAFHLGLAIAFKILVLAVLWQQFVAPRRVSVDTEQASSHLLERQPLSADKE